MNQVNPDQFRKAQAVLIAAKTLDGRIPSAEDEVTVRMWAAALFGRGDYPIPDLMDALAAFYGAPTEQKERIAPGDIVRFCTKRRAEQIERETEQERDRRLFERDRRLGLNTSWYQPNREVREIPAEVADDMKALGDRWSLS